MSVQKKNEELLLELNALQEKLTSLQKTTSETIRSLEKTFNQTIGILRAQRENATDIIVQKEVIILHLKESEASLITQLDDLKKCLEKEQIYNIELRTRSNSL